MVKENTLTVNYAWFVWTIAAFFVLFQVALQTSMSVMIKPMKADLGLNYTQLGVLGACFFYSYMLMQIPSGFLVDALGPRRVLLASLVLTTIACIIYAQASGFWSAALSRFLIGIGVAPAISVAMTIGARWFPISMFALIAGMTESLGMLGGVAGEHGLSILVNSHYAWRGTLLWCALVGAGLLVLTFYCVADVGPSGTSRRAQFKFSNIIAMLKQPQYLLNGLYAAFSFAVVIVFASLWGVPYIAFAFGCDLVTSASICSLFFIGSALGAPVLGLIEHRVQRRNRLMMVMSFLSLVLMLLVLSPQLLSLLELKVVLFCQGILSSSYMMPFILIKQATDEEHKGTALGYTNMMCFVIGAPLLQPLTGAILQTLGCASLVHYQLALLSMPLCYVLALLIAYFIKEPKVVVDER